MASAHASVKHELLVRCLDAWTPAALHGHKRVTYVDVSGDSASANAALKVFCEFEDLLERHTLTMMVVSGSPHVLSAAAPPGLEIRTLRAAEELPASLRGAKGPVFGWFDGAFDVSGTLEEMAAHKGSEVLAALSAAVGMPGNLTLTCRVDLVDEAGRAELLVFGSSSEKALEKFKDELWALDEYAGIRLREPADKEHTLLDISVQPQLGPLRRALVERILHTGASTVGELKTWAMHETMFRTADTMKALQSLVSTNAVTRTPEAGRLMTDTVITPTHRS
jgi:hypothetical protein